MEPVKTFYSIAELEKRTAKIGKIDRGIYDAALTAGHSLSTELELRDPSEPNDSMDAFDRVLALTGIRTESDKKRGIFSDRIERFYEKPSDAMKSRLSEEAQKRFYASDQPVSIVLFPEFINREMRVARLEQDYTEDLIAVTTPVDSDTYRSIYVNMSDKTKWQMKRVGQHAEMPRAKLVTQENAVNLYKYGLVLEATYEALRRMRIDQMRVHLQLIGQQAALDKLGTAVDVLINGDGNNNSATNYTTVSLDAAAPTGTMTYKAWIGWLLTFYPYQCTTVIGNISTIVKLLTMAFPGGDPLMLLAQYGDSNTGLKVQLGDNLFTDIRLRISSACPANVFVGLNKNFALEELTEIGATLTETDKIISAQFSEIALSEVVGFDIMYPQAIRTLTIS